MGSWTKVDGPTPDTCCLITMAEQLGTVCTCESCGKRWVRHDEWRREDVPTED